MKNKYNYRTVRKLARWPKELDKAPNANDSVADYFAYQNIELRQENKRLRMQQAILLCGIGITVLAWGVAIFACLAHFYK